MPTRYPRWIDDRSSVNLREVAPGLYVGAMDSVLLGRWGTVVDFYGHGPVPNSADVHVRIPFLDGNGFPLGALTRLLELVQNSRGPVLIHCAAGLSRSVSAAYAVLVVQYGMSREVAMRRVKADPRFPMARTLVSAERWILRQGR